MKEGIHREGKYDYGEDEELHVLITGNTQQDVSLGFEVGGWCNDGCREGEGLHWLFRAPFCELREEGFEIKGLSLFNSAYFSSWSNSM